jgi:Tfp pilus assembly protein PilF
VAKADGIDPMCTNCGTRLREGWYRCPRCRVIIVASKMPVSPASHRTPARSASSGAPPRAASPGTPKISGSSASSAARSESVSPAAPPAPVARARWPVVCGLLAAIFAAATGSVVYELRKQAGPTITRPVQLETTVSVTPRVDVVSAPVSARPVVDVDALVAKVAADAVRWGQAALADGDLDQAQAQFEAALVAGPEDPDLRNNLAEILIKKGRLNEALTELDRAIALDSTRVRFRINRGRTRARLQQWSGAAEDYRVAAARQPNDAATHYHLGLALMELQRYDAASRAFERAAMLAPDQSSLLVTLGTAYAAAEHQDLARSAFERFLERAPDAAEAPQVRQLLLALDSTPE